MYKKIIAISLCLLIAGFAIGAELQSFFKAKFSGLNNRVNVRLLQDDESPDMSNFNLDEVGSIKERDLFGQYNSTSGSLGSNFITGLFKFYRVSAKHFIACAGSKICSGSGGAWTDITNTGISITSGTYWTASSFVQTGDTDATFYMFNPSVPMQSWSGSGNTTTPGDYPDTNCAYGTSHKNRMWSARSDTYPYRLYYSVIINPESWAAGGYIDLASTTEEITGLVSWGGYLYIFTETNIYVLLGSTENDFSLRKSNSMVGAVAPRSIKITDAGIVFLSRSGVYAFDGNNSRKISDKIENTTNRISNVLIKNACAIYDGTKYWLAYTPSGSSYNNKIIVYDIMLKDWYLYQGNACNINYFERAYGGTDKGELYGGSSTSNGIVYQMQASSATESITHSGESDFNNQVSFNTTVSNRPSVVIKNGNDYFTKLLIHFNGVNGATSYTTEDFGARTVSFNGGSSLSTAQKEFGTTSLLLNGSTGYVTVPDNFDFDFGTKDWTIDYWFYMNSAATANFIFFSKTIDGNNNFYLVWQVGTGKLKFICTNGGVVTSSYEKSWTPPTGAWHHLACVRNGVNFKIYLDGTDIGMTTITGIDNLTHINTLFYIGWDPYNLSYFNGYIDEFRISNGIARWTSAFNPPSLHEYDKAISSGILTSQTMQINAAGTSALDKIDWTSLYPSTNTRITFQTRTGATSDTVFFNGWEPWTSASTVTLNTVTNATTVWFTNDETNFKISKATYPQVRNVLYYEDEDNVSPSLVSFNTVGASSTDKFAWAGVASTDISSYSWLGIWYKSPASGNSVEFSIGESLATENTVTLNTVQPNTWEKAYWYIGNITSTAKDEIKKISVKYKGDRAGSVMLGEVSAYNFYETGDTLTSTPNDWIQYRAIFGSTTLDTPELYSISLTYTPELSVSESSLSSYYYTKPFDFQTPNLNKQFDSLFIECNTTTANTVTPNLCTIYCDYSIDSGTKTGTFSFVPHTTADTVRLIKNFPSSTYGKTMSLKFYNNDDDAKVTIKSCEVRYRTEGAQPN